MHLHAAPDNDNAWNLMLRMKRIVEDQDGVNLQNYSK